MATQWMFPCRGTVNTTIIITIQKLKKVLRKTKKSFKILCNIILPIFQWYLKISSRMKRRLQVTRTLWMPWMKHASHEEILRKIETKRSRAGSMEFSISSFLLPQGFSSSVMRLSLPTFAKVNGTASVGFRHVNPLFSANDRYAARTPTSFALQWIWPTQRPCPRLS